MSVEGAQLPWHLPRPPGVPEARDGRRRRGTAFPARSPAPPPPRRRHRAGPAHDAAIGRDPSLGPAFAALPLVGPPRGAGIPRGAFRSHWSRAHYVIGPGRGVSGGAGPAACSASRTPGRSGLGWARARRKRTGTRWSSASPSPRCSAPLHAGLPGERRARAGGCPRVGVRRCLMGRGGGRSAPEVREGILRRCAGCRGASCGPEEGAGVRSWVPGCGGACWVPGRAPGVGAVFEAPRCVLRAGGGRRGRQRSRRVGARLSAFAAVRCGRISVRSRDGGDGADRRPR